MIDVDLDLAGISSYREPPYSGENEQYAYIQEHMLYELTGYLHSKDEKQFLFALVEYLIDDRLLYREAAMDLLETQFESYGEKVRALLILV